MNEEILYDNCILFVHIPNRKLTFKGKNGIPDTNVVTTTVLPTGPILASFRCQNHIFPSNNRVLVTSSGSSNFSFPVGHYVSKVIIPNQFVIEGGIRTPQRLLQMMNHFSDVQNRKIVFEKNIPQGGPRTIITLPKGAVGMTICPFKRDLPIVSNIFEGSTSCQRYVPVHHVIDKMIIPNEVTLERMDAKFVHRIWNYYSNIDDRIIFLRESHRENSREGGGNHTNLANWYARGDISEWRESHFCLLS
jgi:hypothetical protein